MNAQSLMTRNPTVVLAGDSLSHAATLMRTLDVGMLPVVDDATHRRLVGVLTDRDIVIRCLAEGHLADCIVRDHMTTAPIATVTPGATIREIADKMELSQVRRLPVVSDAGEVIGMVTQADLARRVGPENPWLVEEVLERVSTPGALVA